MAGSINKVILIGNLGKDPEIRHLSNGSVVTTIPIATSENYKDKNTGELKVITEWHNVVLWRRLAEIAEKFLKKGSKVYIEGKIRSRSWEDNEGNMRYATEIVADQMTMLDKASDNKKSPDNIENANPEQMQNPNTDLSNETQEDDLPF